jgi:uncharacterized protein (DUF1499 family)
MRWIVSATAAATLVLAFCIFAAGPGTRLGFWDYGVGLSMIRAVSAPKAIAGGISLSPLFTGLALSVVGAIAGFFLKEPRATTLAGAAALVAGVAALVPIQMKKAFEGNPFIHEVTTDFDDPPQIIAAAQMPRKNPAAYRGDDPVPQSTDAMTVAEAQRAAFPDIAPIIAESDLQSATARAKSVVESMGMEILAEGPSDEVAGGGWRIEAVATSFWFGFKDDFIIRLTREAEGKTRIDLHSKSRVGGSDLGANAKRVREFSKRFNAA